MSKKESCLVDTPLLNFAIGGTAGVVSRTVTAPFERIKILRQNFPTRYTTSLPEVVRSLYNTEGVRGLLRGNMSNCLRVFPQQAIQYSVFQSVNRYLSDTQEPRKRQFVAGALGGIISYLSIYPLETMRSKWSVSTHSKYTSMWHCFALTVRTQGLRGLYQGSMVSTVGMIPFQGTNFVVYNCLKDWSLSADSSLVSSPFVSFTCGGLAGIASVSVAYPFDVLKRRLQLSGEFGNPQYKNVVDCIRYVVQKYGLRNGLYKGLLPCFVKIFPANAIYFATIDALQYVCK